MKERNLEPFVKSSPVPSDVVIASQIQERDHKMVEPAPERIKVEDPNLKLQQQ